MVGFPNFALITPIKFKQSGYCLQFVCYIGVKVSTLYHVFMPKLLKSNISQANRQSSSSCIFEYYGPKGWSTFFQKTSVLPSSIFGRLGIVRNIFCPLMGVAFAVIFRWIELCLITTQNSATCISQLFVCF